MNIFKRIWIILSSLFSIVLSIFLALNPDIGCYFVLVLLAVALLSYGIQQLLYYHSMARFKVGGHITLYVGIISLDLAAVTFGMTDMHPQLIMVYLLLYYIFYGVIRTFSALEAKKLGAASWRLRLFSGVCCLAISALCVLNFSSEKMMVYILCFGLVYSAVMQIVSACRRTTVIYIP